MLPPDRPVGRAGSGCTAITQGLRPNPTTGPRFLCLPRTTSSLAIDHRKQVRTDPPDHVSPCRVIARQVTSQCLGQPARIKTHRFRFSTRYSLLDNRVGNCQPFRESGLACLRKNQRGKPSEFVPHHDRRATTRRTAAMRNRAGGGSIPRERAKPQSQIRSQSLREPRGGPPNTSSTASPGDNNRSLHRARQRALTASARRFARRSGTTVASPTSSRRMSSADAVRQSSMRRASRATRKG